MEDGCECDVGNIRMVYLLGLFGIIGFVRSAFRKLCSSVVSGFVSGQVSS